MHDKQSDIKDNSSKENSKMNKKRTMMLSISMILIMIGMMLVPAAMGDNVNPFTITVSSGQSISITTTDDTSFTEVKAGATTVIEPSFGLTNVGNEAGKIDAKFIVNNTHYGLEGPTSFIPGTSFYMNSNGQSYLALAATDTDTSFGAPYDVAADDVEDDWNVQIIIPAGQTAEAYVGTVELTFADRA